MGSEQSSVSAPKAKAPPQRAPPVRRGHTIAGISDSRPSSSDATASGSNSPGASVCSDSELPYISYTVGRPIGESPKSGVRNERSTARSTAVRRTQSVQPRRRGRDIVVVKQHSDQPLHEDLCRLQEIPTFLPIMRGTLGLPGAKDPEVLEGLDYRPWARLTSRLQAHLAACAHPIAAEEVNLAGKIKESETEISRLTASMCDRQRNNARHAERLSRAHDLARQLSRATSLLQQALQDAEELNLMLPEEKRLEPFVWNENKITTVQS